MKSAASAPAAVHLDRRLASGTLRADRLDSVVQAVDALEIQHIVGLGAEAAIDNSELQHRSSLAT